MSEYLIGLIFLVGLWGVLSKHNIIKKIVALSIINGAIVMFFVHHGSRFGSTAPIREGAPAAGGPASEGTAEAAADASAAAAAMVDPLPQALMLTAIVVGICIIALGLALVVLLHRRFATLDIRRIEAEAWSSRD